MKGARRAASVAFAAALLAAGAARAASTTDYSDQWWVENESGWGASVLQQADVLFVDLFVYDELGRPTWFTAAAFEQAGSPAGHDVFAGDLYLTGGSPWAGTWDPSKLAYRKVGTLTFDAAGVGSATLTYAVGGAPVSKTVARQTWKYETLSGSYRGGESGVQTSCGTGDGRAERFEVLDIAHAADNAVTVRLTDAQSRVRTIAGVYTQFGQLGQIVGTIADPDRGWTGTARLYEVEATPSGITGSGHIVMQQSGTTVCVWDGHWGGVRRAAATGSTLRGKVQHGRIRGATVCVDANRNGRCDAGETQARSDANGAFELASVADPSVPLVAEVPAGTAYDSAQGGSAVDVAFRMASPSGAYSANVTPLTTLVHLVGLADVALAEDLARNDVGLPPRFDMLPAAAPAAGSLLRAVEDAVTKALKASSPALDLASPAALAQVVAAFPSSLTTLPTLRIATRAAAPIVSKEVYIQATFTLDNPMATTGPVVLDGSIRGRGNSTWGQPKNPYHVKLTEDAAYAALPDVLGMKRSRHWALLADYFDRTLIRNKLVLSLASSAVYRDSLKWNPSGQHVEVWLNGEYVGVYLMTELIRIEPNRLDIRVMSADPAANEVDGGYVVEADVRLDCYTGPGFTLKHTTPQGLKFCESRPDEEDITLAQLAWVMDMLDATEADIYAGRLDGIHLPSFVDDYLISELLRNDDSAFLTSVYLWRDTAGSAIVSDRLLNLGPLWDYDRAAGNNDLHDNWQTEGCFVIKPYNPNWFAALGQNPQFVAQAIQRWQAKRSGLERFVNASIDTYVRRLDGARQRNFAKWPIFGVPLTQHYTFATYEEEVAFLRSFLATRMAWMDKVFASPEAFAALCR